MSKSYRNDAKNDKLRREKQNRNNPNQKWQKPQSDQWDSNYEPKYPDDSRDNSHSDDY